MSKSTHQIAVKAVDQTGGAFKSIGMRAKATAASLKGMLGGAIAAAGAYMGMSAVKGTIDGLGKLSDLSMKTGVSVKDLTQSLTAFQTMGLDLDMGRLAKSFQYLKKSTGREGLAGFSQTLAEIAKIEDPLKRGNTLMQDFGRAGMEFMPLIEGGEAAVKAFSDLAAVMPGISDEAANAGDAVADAMNIASSGMKAMWNNAIGYVCGLFAEDLPGGVRAGALNAVNWIETFFKKCHAWIAKVGTEIMSFGALVGDVFTMGPEAAWKLYLDTNAAADSDFERRIEEANAKRIDYVNKLKQVNVDALANALGKKSGKSALSGLGAGGSTVKGATIKNDLILAGSNDAAKLAAFGPQYQSEAKKQTTLLETIAKNTEATTQAIEDGESETNLKEL